MHNDIAITGWLCPNNIRNSRHAQESRCNVPCLEIIAKRRQRRSAVLMQLLSAAHDAIIAGDRKLTVYKRVPCPPSSPCCMHFTGAPCAVFGQVQLATRPTKSPSLRRPSAEVETPTRQSMPAQLKRKHVFCEININIYSSFGAIASDRVNSVRQGVDIA